MDLRLRRPISSTSSNPSVVKMASLAPALCTTTLVARVVPSTIRFYAFRLAIQEAENLADPADHAGDDVGVIGGDFGEADLARGLVDAHHVGEGATDVDPYDHG